MLNEDEIRFEMIVQLDKALHGGVTVARDQSPEDVWIGLLSEVTTLIRAEPPSRERKLDEAIDAVTAWLAKFRSAN